MTGLMLLFFPALVFVVFLWISVAIADGIARVLGVFSDD